MFCLVLFAGNLSAEEKTIVLGGTEGWPQFSSSEGITFGKGRFGYTSVQLATNSRKAGDSTDLLLDFENNSVIDKTGGYTAVTNNLVLIDNAVMGHGAALSRGRSKGLVLKGKPGTVFGTEGNPGSFAIEFWLKPSVAENGEIIFMWNSSRIVKDFVLQQLIMASFANSHIEWNFRNVFDGYTDNSGEIILTSYSTVIPDKWSHHVLMFNEETGLLEYKINGQTEDLKYLTETGHERGTIFQPVLGLAENIQIAPKFTGSVDDFRILRTVPSSTKQSVKNQDSLSVLSEQKYDKFRVTGGRLETQPILTVPGAEIKNIRVISSVPSQTEIRYYIRTGDNFFDWTDTNPEWKEIKPDQNLENITGRFFQLACELYPDGDGHTSPSISEIKINYFEPPLPLAPAFVKAVPGDGCVELSWSYSIDDTTGGYYVYYGSRPGEYLGVEAVNGVSPLNVGNTSSVKITGLKNGAIYYFAVATYSKHDRRIVGNFSDEVFARPTGRKK